MGTRDRLQRSVSKAKNQWGLRAAHILTTYPRVQRMKNKNNTISTRTHNSFPSRFLRLRVLSLGPTSYAVTYELTSRHVAAASPRPSRTSTGTTPMPLLHATKSRAWDSPCRHSSEACVGATVPPFHSPPDIHNATAQLRFSAVSQQS
jgi:hypothetical protein